MPISISIDTEALDAVGTEPLSEYVEPGSLKDQFQKAQEDLWKVSMVKEAELLRHACFADEPVELELVTAKNTERVRMRLYRCKRQLLEKGNRYVSLVTFSITGTRITIDRAEDLMKYVVQKPSEK